MELEHTRDWELEHEQGELRLFSFHCNVEYNKRWAIVNIDDEVILNFDKDDYGSPINFFCGVVEVITNIENRQKAVNQPE